MSEIKTSPEYFCIFAGGGVRGTSYVGVIDMLNRHNVVLNGVAGSSVGAIYATFYAIGCTSEEIEKISMDLKYDMLKDLHFSFGGKGLGIFKGDNLYNWIKEIIERKIYGDIYIKDAMPPVTFKDLDKNLIITATNITTNKSKYYSKVTTPNVEIAMAIRTSTSIPGFFQPVWENEECLVDGDIVKNIPLWEVSNLIPKNTRILECRLIGSPEARAVKNPIDYFNAVIDASSNAGTDYIIDKYGKNDNYDFLKINTGHVQVIDFSISDVEKQNLINIGRLSTEKFLLETLKEKRLGLKLRYIEILDNLKKIEHFLKSGNIKEAKYNMGLFGVCLAKNQEYIQSNIYEKLLNFVSVADDNFYLSDFLKTQKIRNIKEVLFKLRKMIFVIEKHIKRLV